MHRFIQNNPTLDHLAYGRWWQITINEFPDLIKTNNSNTKQDKQDKQKQSNKQTDDQITNKLMEIRNKISNSHNQSSKNTREIIEKSIEQHVLNGLSITEAVEYEANQTRMKQLQEKMCKTKDDIPNQYIAKESSKHA